MARATAHHAGMLASETMRRASISERLMPAKLAPYLGYSVPRAADCQFVFHDVHFDDHRQCSVEHITATGARFRGAVVQCGVRWMLASERMRLDHTLSVAALRSLQASIRAHNAVVQPIDNGPDDRVYLVETGHRVAEAVKATCEGRPDSTELQAACRANLYAADIVIANFNRNPQE